MTAEPAEPVRFTRRRVLGAGAATALGLVLVGCSDDGDQTTTSASSTTAATSSTTEPSKTTTTWHETQPPGTPATTVFTAQDFAALGVCQLLPEQTAGPFPSPAVWERRNIAEDRTGHPLRIGVQVVDETCAPLPNAVVDLWHCDVDGDYSAYLDGATKDDAGPSTTFLRGAQSTNAEGIVEIQSIYPGWYRGRAVHIHAKVTEPHGRTLTTQLYFDDELSKRIFAKAPYRGDQDTLNSQDAIAGDPKAQGNLLHVSADQAIKGSRALVVIGLAPPPGTTTTTAPDPNANVDGSGSAGTDGEDGADGQMGGPHGSAGGGEGGAGGTGGAGGQGQPGERPPTMPPPGTTPMGPGPTTTTTSPDGVLHI